MSYQKVYERINWENYPSDKTPLNEATDTMFPMSYFWAFHPG